MSGFSNPIVGALGRLIRQAIQSANFVAGVSGWRIEQSGAAELNDAVIRGSLIVTDPDGSYVKIYDENPGNGAVIAIAAAGGGLVGYIRTGLVSSAGEPGMQIIAPDFGGVGFNPALTFTMTPGGAPLVEFNPYQLYIDAQGGGMQVVGALAATIGPASTQYIESAGDSVVNSTVLKSVADMTFVGVAGAVYEIKLRAAFGGPQAADVKVAWLLPGGPAGNMARCIIGAASGITDNAQATMVANRRSATTAQPGGTSGGVSNDFTCWFEDIIYKPTVTGNVYLQFAQNVANVTATDLKGQSYMLVTRLS